MTLIGSRYTAKSVKAGFRRLQRELVDRMTPAPTQVFNSLAGYKNIICMSQGKYRIRV